METRTIQKSRTTLESHPAALSPVARPWMRALAQALIPGYCDPGLVYEQLLKPNLPRARSWVDAGCGDNLDIHGEPGCQGLAVGFDLPVRTQETILLRISGPSRSRIAPWTSSPAAGCSSISSSPRMRSWSWRGY